MTKRTLGILLAVTAIAVFATVVIASSLGGDDQAGTHAMPGGQMMNDSEMSDSMMDKGSTEGTGSSDHMMKDGESMDNGMMNDDECGDESEGDGGGSQ